MQSIMLRALVLSVLGIASGHQIAHANGPTIDVSRDLLFQDSFPPSGNADASTQLARDGLDIRLDVGRGVGPIPGDAIVAYVTPINPLATISASGVKLKWVLHRNEYFEAAIRTSAALVDDLGLGCSSCGSGEVQGQLVATQGSSIQVSLDLPDADFFYPGDDLQYYIEATDSEGGVATLPEEFSDFGVRTHQLAGSPFMVRGLPSIGQFGAPSILVVEVTEDLDAYDETVYAFGNLGLNPWYDYDLFRPFGDFSLGDAGTIGATPDQLAHYSCMMYLVGDNPHDDTATITGWFNQTGPRALWTFGNNAASGIESLGTTGADFVANVLGVAVTSADVGPQLPGQTSPTVEPITLGFATNWVASGPSSFDAIAPLPGAAVSHEWVTVPGIAPGAGVLWDRVEGGERKVSHTFPVAFDAIWETGADFRAVPNRTSLLEELLNYAEGHAASDPVISVPVSTGRFQVGPAFPNPFNPSTSIQLSVPHEGHVRVEIFTLRGERVAVLLNEAVSAGAMTLTWDGLDASGRSVASGVYVVRGEGLGERLAQRVVLLK